MSKNYLDIAKRYPITIETLAEDDGGGYAAYCSAFYGLLGDGETPQDAYEDFIDVLTMAVEDHINNSGELPKTNRIDEESEYSGRVSLRMPKSTHRLVSLSAVRDGVSLNAFIVSAIQYYLGVCSDGIVINKNEPSMPHHHEYHMIETEDERIEYDIKKYQFLRPRDNMEKWDNFSKNRNTFSTDWRKEVSLYEDIN